MNDPNYYTCEQCRYRKTIIDTCRRADTELMFALNNCVVALGHHDAATTQIAQAREILADAAMTLFRGLQQCQGRETLAFPLPE